MEVTKIDYSKFEVFDDPMFKFNEKAHEYTYTCDKSGDILVLRSNLKNHLNLERSLRIYQKAILYMDYP